MSDQDMEMQFADPDWQPGLSRPGSSARKQSLSIPVEIKDAPDSQQQIDEPGSATIRDRDKANAYGDYSQGYQAAPANDRHHEQPGMPIWTPSPGQTPPWTIPSIGADSSSGAGKGQQTQKQQSSPKRVKSRRQRWLPGLLARVALVVMWVSTPLVTRAFHGGWILPLLGVFFLPVTALTYTVVFALAGSVTGPAWLWVVGALLIDLASNVGQASKRK
jgi:hypothetical protein